MTSLCSISSEVGWMDKLFCGLFVFIFFYWGTGYSKHSNCIWIVKNDSSCLGETGCTAVPRVGAKLTVSGALSREEGEKGLCVIFLRKAGTTMGWGAGSKQRWCLSSQAGVAKLCSKWLSVFVFNILIFNIDYCVYEDGNACRSWHHLTVSL